MTRAVKEWIGKSDDDRVPPRVRLRVLEAYGRKCYLSGREIRPGDAWELEHVIALILGGAHRESNLAPALVAPHNRKTATEMAIKSKIADVAKKHAGITASKQPIRSRGFAKRPRPSPKPMLPARSLYVRGELLQPGQSEGD